MRPIPTDPSFVAARTWLRQERHLRLGPDLAVTGDDIDVLVLTNATGQYGDIDILVTDRASFHTPGPCTPLAEIDVPREVFADDPHCAAVVAELLAEHGAAAIRVLDALSQAHPRPVNPHSLVAIARVALTDHTDDVAGTGGNDPRTLASR